MNASEPVFFDSPEEFRAWLKMHHLDAPEVIVGFYKAKTGMQGMTWSQAVDEALCFGWIDSIGRRIDERRHSVRFTPRRPGSIWSAVNVAKVETLTRENRMRPAGIAAFERRSEARTGTYAHERGDEPQFDELQRQDLENNPSAWEFFQNQAPWYRRAATHWVISAKRQETRDRRFATLLEDSAAGRTIKSLTRQPAKK